MFLWSSLQGEKNLGSFVSKCGITWWSREIRAVLLIVRDADKAKPTYFFNSRALWPSVTRREGSMASAPHDTEYLVGS